MLPQVRRAVRAGRVLVSGKPLRRGNFYVKRGQELTLTAGAEAAGKLKAQEWERRRGRVPPSTQPGLIFEWCFAHIHLHTHVHMYTMYTRTFICMCMHMHI